MSAIACPFQSTTDAGGTNDLYTAYDVCADYGEWEADDVFIECGYKEECVEDPDPTCVFFECRSDNDCDGGERCSDDNVCVPVECHAHDGSILGVLEQVRVPQFDFCAGFSTVVFAYDECMENGDLDFYDEDVDGTADEKCSEEAGDVCCVPIQCEADDGSLMLLVPALQCHDMMIVLATMRF